MSQQFNKAKNYYDFTARLLMHVLEKEPGYDSMYARNWDIELDSFYMLSLYIEMTESRLLNEDTVKHLFLKHKPRTAKDILMICEIAWN